MALDRPVKTCVGYALALIYGVTGLAALIVFAVATKVPDSVYAAATYLGVTGFAIAARTNPHTSRTFSRTDFIVRAVTGFVIVIAAGVFEVVVKQPDWASVSVYILAVAVEGLLFSLDLRSAKTPSGAGAAGTGAAGAV